MLKMLKHFVTITKHRNQVIRNGFHMGIFFHCLRHDLSKYGPLEFFTSAKYYAGDHSPVYEERMANAYFSKVCQHHTRRNKHHYEYWTDFFMGRVIAKRMPYKYATEYVCDVLSASKTYHPDEFAGEKALEYFKRHSQRYFINSATVEYVTWCLEQYAETGWKNLKKKTTKAKYEEIAKKHPDVELFVDMPKGTELPKLKSDKGTFKEVSFDERMSHNEKEGELEC